MIDVTDFQKAADALTKKGFENVAGRAASSAIRRSINAVRRKVRSRLRPHRKTGRTASNVRTRFKGRGMEFEGRVYSGGPIAHLLVGGVAQHDIRPMAKRALTIHGPGKSGPIVAFADAVTNPGFPGDPYFARGVDDATSDINDSLAKAVDQMGRDLAYQMSRR